MPDSDVEGAEEVPANDEANMPVDASEEQASSDTDGSLTDEDDAGLSDFLDEISGEGEEPSEEEDVPEKEEKDDEPLAEDDTPAEDADDTLPEEAEPDEEEEDEGVDLSDFEDKTESADDDGEFDPTAELDLPKKDWKALPEDVRSHIVKSRKAFTEIQQQLESRTHFATFGENLLNEAQKVGLGSEAIVDWLDLTLQAKGGSAEAMAAIGTAAVDAGWQPPATEAAPEFDRDALTDYLQKQHKDLELSKEQAQEIMRLTEPAKVEKTNSAPQTKAKAQLGVDHERVNALANEAMANIDTIESRYSERYKDRWPAMSKTIHSRIRAENVSQPVADPTKWAGRYAKHAKIVEKEYRDRDAKRKKAKGKQRMSGKDSALRTDGGEPAHRSNKADPREDFLSEHSY